MSSALPALLLLAVNILAFTAFGWDKRAAQRGDWRVRESTLLLMAFLGGSAGALLGRQVFRHKTRKEPFRSLLLGIAALHMASMLMWLFTRTH